MPVAYAPRKLNVAERGYRTHEREHLAIVYCLQQWRLYLHGSKFEIQTDHHTEVLRNTKKVVKKTSKMG